MQVRNDYEKIAFNGDIGFVTAIDTDEAEVLIDFDSRQIVYEFGETATGTSRDHPISTTRSSCAASRS